MRKRLFNFSASVLGIAAMTCSMSCGEQKQPESPMKVKVEEYAPVELKSDLVNGLSENEDYRQSFLETDFWRQGPA